MKSSWKNTSQARKDAVELGFRSGLEKATFENLTARGVKVTYEDREIKFTPPVKQKTYHPDFTLPNGILVETKGRFVTADRQKHKAIKALYPALDIRFVFSNAQAKISKTSKTTYAMWCEENGFKWADKFVPQEWLDEPWTNERWEAVYTHTIITKDKERGTL